ncbi:MAG: ATPase, T2SS/T4P/T4SS family [Thermoguttaceae bacterium]|jgi:type II secretory ATPase GspE/PulE/Tfp pilus assembly ATPase PilB-like protein
MRPFRPILIPALVAIVLAVSAQTLWADESPAQYLLRGAWRGTGFYLSWIKILSAWLVFLAWIATTGWVNQDVQDRGLNWLRWNAIVAGSFFAAIVLAWEIPWFWLGWPLMWIAWIAPLASYIVYRNSRAPSHEKVLTRDHLRHLASRYLGKVGVKVSAEASDPNRGGSPLTVFGRGGANPQADAARLLAARQCEGLPEARRILAEALAARASGILLDFTQSSVARRYLVDGVWMPQEPLDRETADPALVALKTLAGLKPDDRRARQEGPFGVEYQVIRHEVFGRVDRAEAQFREKLTIDLTKKMASEELKPPQLQQQVAAAVEEEAREKFATPIGRWTPVDRDRLPKLPGIDALNPATSVEPVKCPATLAAQGTASGERVLIQFEVKTAQLATLDEVGMRAKVQEMLKEAMNRPKGFVLLAAVPGGGLRTTTKALLQGMDRFVREFMAVEDEGNRYEEVENVPVHTYRAAAGETLAAFLPKVFREEPNVLVVRDLVDAAAVAVLCHEISANERLVISTVRARDCAEALLRVVAMGVPPADFARLVTAVLCQRLVRKLCDKCKEPYAPGAQVLQQLGIPEGRVRAFFRPPQAKPTDQDRKEPCRECGGSGYLGQTALFEIVVLDDTLRKTLAAAPKLDALRQAARKAGMKNFQEEGVLMVARGVTSLQELTRVLKG